MTNQYERPNKSVAVDAFVLAELLEGWLEAVQAANQAWNDAVGLDEDVDPEVPEISISRSTLSDMKSAIADHPEDEVADHLVSVIDSYLIGVDDDNSGPTFDTATDDPPSMVSADPG